MFHPNDRPMDRGWVGRIDGDKVVHLAAQTLQHYFTGGGGAREHAEYALADVTILVPVLQPPAVRLFDEAGRFAFGNPTAVVGPGARVPRVGPDLSVHARLTAVIGADGAIGGYTGLVEWWTAAAGAKANDFGLVLGPVVATDVDPTGLAAVLRWEGVTESRAAAPGFDWAAAIAHAALGTSLRVGDLVAGPRICSLDGMAEGAVTLELDGIGTLRSQLDG